MKNLRVVTATMALGGGLLAGIVTAAPSEAAEYRETVGAMALVSVSPRPEYIADPIKGRPIDWVNNCPPGRFCAYQKQTVSGSSYVGFQFYKCTEYALTNWGVNYVNPWGSVFNNQNVTVKYLNQRHAEIDSTPPWSRDVVNWKPVWYISLCN